MPIYEYQCQQCGYHFDKLQRFNAKPLLECPQCHQPSLHKLVSAAGFQLKGQGWYVTDFKNKSSKKTEDSPKKEAIEQPTSQPVEAKESTKTENKTEVKVPKEQSKE